MAKGLFQSPKKAMLFVGMTVFSVIMLVGTEDDEGALVKAASTIDVGEPEYARDERFTPQPQRRELFVEDDLATEFTPDEDLLDTAEGFDPTPDEIDPYEPEIDLGSSDAQVVRVETGDGAEMQF